MKKLVMMAACAAMVMGASAAVIAPDKEHRLTGVYYADNEIALTSYPDVGKIEGNATEKYALIFCDSKGNRGRTVKFDAGAHTFVFPYTNTYYGAYATWTDIYYLEDLAKPSMLIEIVVYKDQDPCPSVQVQVARLGYVAVRDDGTMWWWSSAETGEVEDSLPVDDDEDDEPTVEPEPTPEPTPTTSKCPVLSFFRRIFRR